MNSNYNTQAISPTRAVLPPLVSLVLSLDHHCAVLQSVCRAYSCEDNTDPFIYLVGNICYMSLKENKKVLKSKSSYQTLKIITKIWELRTLFALCFSFQGNKQIFSRQIKESATFQIQRFTTVFPLKYCWKFNLLCYFNISLQLAFKSCVFWVHKSWLLFLIIISQNSE